MSALQAAAAANLARSNDGSSPRGTPHKRPRVDTVFAEPSRGVKLSMGEPAGGGGGGGAEAVTIQPSPLINLVSGELVEELLARLVNAALAEQQREISSGGSSSSAVAAGGGGAAAQPGGGDDQRKTPWQAPAAAVAPPQAAASSETGQDKGDELLAANEELNLAATQQVGL